MLSSFIYKFFQYKPQTKEDGESAWAHIEGVRDLAEELNAPTFQRFEAELPREQLSFRMAQRKSNEKSSVPNQTFVV
jgi:hypothetical protein